MSNMPEDRTIADHLAEAESHGRVSELRHQLAACRAEVEERDARIRELSARNILDEERLDLADDPGRVRIRFNGPGGWLLKDLEEIAYRLRLGGAVDTTVVEVWEYGIEAKVPAPDMVHLDPPAAEPQTAPERVRWLQYGPSPEQALATAIVAAERSWNRQRIGFATAVLVAVVLAIVVIL